MKYNFTIIALVFGISILSGCSLNSRVNTSCETGQDCTLVYIGNSACAPCDLSDEHFICASKEGAAKINDDRINKYGQIMCKPCQLSPIIVSCSCENYNCKKIQ
ncbi:MAG: hypothetical protein V1859_09085 [archaeon]